MRKYAGWALMLLILLMSACASGESFEDVEAAAQRIMASDSMDDAAITEIVAGDPATMGADELYCVATDATTQNGELPYLVLVWRMDDNWDGMAMAEGYYEWDLWGCPRDG